MIRNNVVLPEPLSPRTVRNSPSAISSEMSRNTRDLPNDLAILRIERRLCVLVIVEGCFESACATVAIVCSARCLALAANLLAIALL